MLQVLGGYQLSEKFILSEMKYILLGSSQCQFCSLNLGVINGKSLPKERPMLYRRKKSNKWNSKCYLRVYVCNCVIPQAFLSPLQNTGKPYKMFPFYFII